MRTVLRPGVAALVCLLALFAIPSHLFAQETAIAGTVRDASGGVLAGVTVEASSPALIEKVRIAVTDGLGQYRIVNLSSGVYTVTFTLQGFATVRRAGIELSDGFIAPVNAEMRVGQVEETVNVSATAPVVDVQSPSNLRTVMTREVMDAIPTGRNIQAVGILIPGTTLQVGGGAALSRDVGGSGNMQQSPLTYHGSTASVTTVDGLRMNDLEVSGQYSDLFNDGSFEEVSYSTGADNAEMGQGGLRINMVPKEGGNTFRGSVLGNWTGEPWQWDNCHQASVSSPCTYKNLEGRGITSVVRVQTIYDFNPTFGGPIVQDRLWFQGTFRHQRVDKTVVDSYFDANPDPVKYAPNLERQALDDGWAMNAAIRLTGQLSEKNKLSGYFDRSNRERDHWGASATTPPEASGRQTLPMEYTLTTKFQSAVSSRLLFEAGFGRYHQDYTELYQPEVTPTTYRINDQLTGRNCCAYSRETWHYAWINDYSGKISYVTGAHNFTAGWTGTNGRRRYTETNTGNLTMRFGATTVNADANGFGPNRVTLILPTDEVSGITMDNGFFVNDKWTFKRATFSGGLRFDWFIGNVQESSVVQSRWLDAYTFSGDELGPNQGKSIPNWKDLSPRLGVSYDLFGNGKTALKASLSRYVDAEAVGFAQSQNPINRLDSSENLTWTDNSRDFTIFNPDGSVQDINFNPNAPIDPNTGLPQNELAALPANSTFGTLVTSTTRVDPAIREGWHVRGYSWEVNAGIQHELMARVSTSFTYWRRLTGGNTVTTDNLNEGPEDFNGPFCIDAPADPRLPGGGGDEYCGIYQQTPESFSITEDNYQTFVNNHLDRVGGKRTVYRHGFDATVRGRLPNGGFVQGGVSFDRSVSDTCYTQLLGDPTSIISPITGQKACDTVAPFKPDIKLTASYNFPWDIRVSAAYQHVTGPIQGANWTFTQAVANANGWQIATAPGSTPNQIASANETINLLTAAFEYDKPLNQLDIRTARRFRFGRYRFELQADLYNVFNDNWIFSESETFGTSTGAGLTPSSTWLRPTNVLVNRMFKMGLQFDF
jgi:hypothetical protein